jgi:hypothetical protein
VDFLNGLTAAAAVLICVIFIAWKFGRGKPGSRFLALARPKSSRIRVLEHMRLTPQHSLHLIDDGGREILVGCHGGGMVLLSDRRRSSEVRMESSAA